MDYSTVYSMMPIYCFSLLLYAISQLFRFDFLLKHCSSILLAFHLGIQRLGINDLDMSHVHYELFSVLGTQMFIAINY